MSKNNQHSSVYKFPTAESRMSEIVVQQIEELIALGEFPLDKPLPPERELMAKFGASRTVIREAIAQLASQGLLDVRPRHRPIVRQPGYDAVIGAMGGIVKHQLAREGGVRQLYELRIFCERMLVREASVKATKEDIRNLKDALCENERQIPNSQKFYETDIAFHGTLFHMTTNPIFSGIHGAFSTWLSPKWAMMARSPERNQRNFDAHKAIYDAILERDPDLAEKQLIDHLDTAWQDIKDNFSNE